MSLLDGYRKALRSFPRIGRHELYCHTSVYLAIQRVGDIQPQYPPYPLDRFFGADVIVAPELGEGVWEMYADGKLVGYGRIK